MIEKVMKKIEELKKVPSLYEFTLEHCFLAGGAVRDLARNEKPKDWDLFFYTEEGKEEFVKNFGRFCTETGIGNFNYNDFQFITLYTGTPEEVVNIFDWNVNMQYVSLNENKYRYWNSNFSELRFNCDARKPLSAYLRLPDMLTKGYRINKEEMMFMLSFIAQTSPIRGGADLSKEFEFVSSGGGFVGSDKAENAVNRASEEAQKRSPLYKML